MADGGFIGGRSNGESEWYYRVAEDGSFRIVLPPDASDAELWNGINDFAFSPPREWTAAQRPAMLALLYDAMMSLDEDHGSMLERLENEEDGFGLSEMLRSLRAVGADGRATLLEEAVQLREADGEDWDCSALDRASAALEPRVDGLLIAYVRAHLAEFVCSTAA